MGNAAAPLPTKLPWPAAPQYWRALILVGQRDIAGYVKFKRLLRVNSAKHIELAIDRAPTVRWALLDKQGSIFTYLAFAEQI